VNCAKSKTIEALVEYVMEIGRHCASLPVLDRRRPDEIQAMRRTVFRNDN
jgi:hypothetical protein